MFLISPQFIVEKSISHFMSCLVLHMFHVMIALLPWQITGFLIRGSIQSYLTIGFAIQWHQYHYGDVIQQRTYNYISWHPFPGFVSFRHHLIRPSRITSRESSPWCVAFRGLFWEIWTVPDTDGLLSYRTVPVAILALHVMVILCRIFFCFFPMLHSCHVLRSCSHVSL